MSRSLNKVQLIGNVGAAPEVRTARSGARTANLRLATNRSWRESDGHEHDETEWHHLVLFGKLVDVVETYVAKGDRLYVEGSVHYSTSERDDGATSYWTEIRVRQLIMLGSPPARTKVPEDGIEPDKNGGDHDDLPF